MVLDKSGSGSCAFSSPSMSIGEQAGVEFWVTCSSSGFGRTLLEEGDSEAIGSSTRFEEAMRWNVLQSMNQRRLGAYLHRAENPLVPCRKGVPKVNEPLTEAGKPKGNHIAPICQLHKYSNCRICSGPFPSSFSRRTIFLRRTIVWEECAKSILTPLKSNPTHSSQTSFFSFFLIKNCFSFSFSKTFMRTIPLVRTMVCRENDCFSRERSHGRENGVFYNCTRKNDGRWLPNHLPNSFWPHVHSCTSQAADVSRTHHAEQNASLSSILARWRARQHKRRKTGFGRPRTAFRGVLILLLVIGLVVFDRWLVSFDKRFGKRLLTTERHPVEFSHILILVAQIPSDQFSKDFELAFNLLERVLKTTESFEL